MPDEWSHSSILPCETTSQMLFGQQKACKPLHQEAGSFEPAPTCPTGKVVFQQG